MPKVPPKKPPPEVPPEWVSVAQAWLDPSMPVVAKGAPATVTPRPTTRRLGYLSFVHCYRCRQNWPTTFAPTNGCRNCYSQLDNGTYSGPGQAQGDWTNFGEDQDLALIMEEFISNTDIQQLLNRAFIRIQSNHHDASRHTLIKKYIAHANDVPTAEQILRLRWLARNTQNRPRAEDFANSRAARNRISATWPLTGTSGVFAEQAFVHECGPVLPEGVTPVIQLPVITEV